ncbi:hypothetical protein FPZ12_009385 [Amycolatopsis acidicola]|uniref:DUF2637 domain-containing protein n=1 Tax=Amycolatopsis acidicola TaxID=2596893 RepID=A0A5N0VCA8_9PSEU|nr:hypothetical protein [Amycolatopsis acidicola]KAA9163208.1 hypothetical protein FPZ12_009385 [Amycolatopsis acidicola]
MNASSQGVARFVTITMGLVIGLTFLFGFGNVLHLALKLQVPVLVAPLVAPAVDLTVLGLLVGTRHLALSGASNDALRSARRLLLAASAVTLLLNIADPVCTGQWGKAAFDSVGPLLLIGWAEAGPGLLRALSSASNEAEPVKLPSTPPSVPPTEPWTKPATLHSAGLDQQLLDRARAADSEHWRRAQRPISAETLRKRLRVGAQTSRLLVSAVRAESTPAHAGPPQ